MEQDSARNVLFNIPNNLGYARDLIQMRMTLLLSSGVPMQKMPTITKKDFVDRIAKNTQTEQILVKTIVQNFLEEIIA